MTDQSATAQPTLATFYSAWHTYQDHLIAALAPLNAEQLALRAAPQLRSIGEIATHMIGARARWIHLALGEGDEAFGELAMWDRPEMPVRSAAELVKELEATWLVMQSLLGRWTPEDMAQVFERTRGGQTRRFTRAWVVWHLIEHDLHHGGEISLSLGMHGLTAPEI